MPRREVPLREYTAAGGRGSFSARFGEETMVVVELDQAKREVWEPKTANLPSVNTRPNYPIVPAHRIGTVANEDDIERIERWMNWKRAAKLRTSLLEQLTRAAARGSKGTNVKLEDLAILLALVEPGEEPK